MLYAVGDIHGEAEMLEELLASLPHRGGDRFVFVGDYVDRGPDSRRVVDLLIGFARARHCVFLLGNHESMFLDFLGWNGRAYFGGHAFLMNGGDRTLESYGYFDVADPNPRNFELSPEHELFYKQLRTHPDSRSRGLLEPALQHRNRHGRRLRRPPDRHPTPRRDGLPGLTPARELR